ncbi:MAG: gluconate 2-dehydrogenase subunit 3 family protein [Acetobacteraceae bacterium]|nr:gluconate 2-dehydrogenase subunit 3 family protein [Acetobacteraceae bacterium]
MTEMRRFPGYSTLAKRDTPSWNDATRKAVETRVYQPPPRRFFTEDEFAILQMVCDRIVPQPGPREDKVPIANFIDQKMAENHGDGYRPEGEPTMQEMWRRGLRAIDAEARLRFQAPFTELPGGRQDDLLRIVQNEEVRAPEWAGVPVKSFFRSRVQHDTTTYYYGNPRGWDEMGFGGPASPRGYVRMGFDRHDPWDAIEEKPKGYGRA